MSPLKTHTTTHNRVRFAGFTLVELMIAITLGIMVVGGIGAFFLQTKQSSRQNESFARLQENGRYALHFLAEELQHAGLYGKMSYLNSYGQDSSLGPAKTACGLDWLGSPLLYDSGKKSIAYSCISDDDDIYDGINGVGTDVMVIKNTLPIPVTILQANHIYIRTNGDKNCLWQYPGNSENPDHVSCPPNDNLDLTKDTDDWELTNSVYYIKLNDNQIPSLYRETLVHAATPIMTGEQLVEGIERFIIEFGINETGTDKIIDKYSTILPGDLTTVMSARIYVLVRADKPDWDYTNTKTYSLGTTDIAVNDNYHRKVFSTTVILRNLFNKSNFP